MLKKKIYPQLFMDNIKFYFSLQEQCQVKINGKYLWQENGGNMSSRISCFVTNLATELL
jgi:hypothetical protein